MNSINYIRFCATNYTFCARHFSHSLFAYFELFEADYLWMFDAFSMVIHFTGRTVVKRKCQLEESKKHVITNLLRVNNVTRQHCGRCKCRLQVSVYSTLRDYHCAKCSLLPIQFYISMHTFERVHDTLVLQMTFTLWMLCLKLHLLVNATCYHFIALGFACTTA